MSCGKTKNRAVHKAHRRPTPTPRRRPTSHTLARGAQSNGASDRLLTAGQKHRGYAVPRPYNTLACEKALTTFACASLPTATWSLRDQPLGSRVARNPSVACWPKKHPHTGRPTRATRALGDLLCSLPEVLAPAALIYVTCTYIKR